MKSTQLISTLFMLVFFVVLGCGKHEPEPISAIGLIQGGHQIEYSDAIVDLSYGVFDRNGEPKTSFKQGEEIVFSFWLKNKVSESLDIRNFENNPIMDVYLLNGGVQDEHFGRPYGGFCVSPTFSTILANDIWKIDIPWMSDLDIEFDCPSIAKEPLPRGDYVSSFIHNFEIVLEDGSLHETGEIDFSIEFEVQ